MLWKRSPLQLACAMGKPSFVDALLTRVTPSASALMYCIDQRLQLGFPSSPELEPTQSVGIPADADHLGCLTTLAKYQRCEDVNE